MTTSQLESHIHYRSGAAVLELEGQIDGEAERALSHAYAQVEDAPQIVLNFDAVDYINSTGIALIVGLLAQARQNQQTVTACGLSDHYREIFEITRLSDFMKIVADEESAFGARSEEA